MNNERKRYRGRRGLRRLWAKMQKPFCESDDPNYIAPPVWAAVVIIVIAMGTASFCVGLCVGEARQEAPQESHAALDGAVLVP